jgi:hypothetical protein
LRSLGEQDVDGRDNPRIKSGDGHDAEWVAQRDWNVLWRAHERRSAKVAPMNTVVLAISIAYVVMAVLLLCMGLTSRFAWWIKGVVIVITSAFFIESFFATKSLLGWPGTGQLPHRFQLLWTRVVEPDPKVADPGAIYLWVEELDENNVPSGTPRSFKLKYSPPLADRSNKAKDEIMAGNPQEGTASDMEGDDTNRLDARLDQLNGPNRPETGLSNIEIEMLRQAQQIEFRPLSGIPLPPKN